MSRLTKKNECACQVCKDWETCHGDESCIFYKVYEKLSHYEDLEE